MKEGAWINIRTGASAWVDEHARFVQRQKDADSIGLPSSVFARIAEIPYDNLTGPNRQAICLEVLKAGFVRMRGHGNYWTFEFLNTNLENAMWAVYTFMSDYGGPYTTARINVLNTAGTSVDTIEMLYKDLEQTLKTVGPEGVLRHSAKTRLRHDPTIICASRILNS